MADTTPNAYGGDRAPAIIDTLLGKSYEGPLSDFDEWHALELGVLAGLWAASPEFATIATALFGAKSVMGVVDGSLKRQVRHEPHYFSVGAAITYIITSLIEGAPLTQIVQWFTILG